MIEEIVIFIIGQENVVHSEGNSNRYDREKLTVDHFWEFEG